MTNANETAAAAVSAGGMTVRVKRFPASARLPRHRHERAYCCLLLRGIAEERQAGARLQLVPSSLSVRPPGCAHAVTFGRDPATAVIIELEPSRFEFFAALGLTSRPDVCRVSAATFGAAARLSRELPARDSASRLIVEGIALELLGTTVRDLTATDASDPPAWLRTVRERLLDRSEEVGTIAQLAHEVGIHPSHLAAAFKSWYGESAGDLVRRRRFEVATELLRTRDLPLAEIAIRAGYYDQSHFTNDFRKRTGLTPGTFRAEVRPDRPRFHLRTPSVE